MERDTFAAISHGNKSETLALAEFIAVAAYITCRRYNVVAYALDSGRNIYVVVNLARDLKVNNVHLDRSSRSLPAYGGRVCVVSWLAKNSTARYDNVVMAAKMLWLRENLPALKDIRIVSYGTPKPDCVRNVCNSILFDDEIDNRVEWIAAGGQARKPEYLTRTLERLVKNVLLHPVRS